MNKKLERIISATATVVLIFGLTPAVFAAGALTTVSDTMTRQGSAATSDHTIKFTTPTGIANGNTVTLAFPASSFTMAASLAGVTIAQDAGADNAVTSAAWNSGSSTLTITASASSIVAATHVATIKIPTAQITNPTVGSPTTYVVSIAGTFTDTGKFAVVVVPNDQFSVNASVDPSLTFGIDTTTMNLGILNSVSPSTATSVQTTNGYVQLTTSTNAASGYSISVHDVGSAAGPGLYNASSNFTIGSSNYTYGATQDLSAAAGYGLQATSATDTIAAPYTSTATTVGKIQKTSQTLATYASPASANNVNMVVKAKVTGATPAGSYTDTLTLIATANF